jgi:hypothetical protein
VLTPFLYSPKAKNEWGLRRLGIHKTLACLNYPDDWTQWLAKAGVDRDFLQQQPAMACFVAGATRWLTALLNNNEGGMKEEMKAERGMKEEIKAENNKEKQEAKKEEI